MPRPKRPRDADYYKRDRVDLFSQGDLFRDVPLAYPLPADELVVDDESGGSRRFLSGPLEFGPAMLITPSCSLGAQGTIGYGHPSGRSCRFCRSRRFVVTARAWAARGLA